MHNKRPLQPSANRPLRVLACGHSAGSAEVAARAVEYVQSSSVTGPGLADHFSEGVAQLKIWQRGQVLRIAILPDNAADRRIGLQAAIGPAMARTAIIDDDLGMAELRFDTVAACYQLPAAIAA